MNEQAILAELQRSWISRSDRRRLEQQLAALRQAAGSSPVAHADSYEGIRIEGDSAFVRATKAALAKLRGTPSWALAKELRVIKPASDARPGTGGHVQDRVFHVGSAMAQTDPTLYASTIVHEGAHARDGHRSGTEAERLAFRAQGKALAELGASHSLRSWCARQAEDPKHHL
jgi:hypothetical protein